MVDICLIVGASGIGKSRLARRASGFDIEINKDHFNFLHEIEDYFGSKTPSYFGQEVYVFQTSFGSNITGEPVFSSREGELINGYHDFIESPILSSSERVLVAELYSRYRAQKNADASEISFSGGEKKALQALRVSFSSVRFAVFDELDSGVDPVMWAKITAVLKVLMGRGSKFAFVTHSPEKYHILGRTLQIGLT